MGLDPGTTAAYALLDLSGNVVALRSGKHLPLDVIIRETVSYGRVLIIGTDKKNIPSFVDTMRVKLGARVIAPHEDLLVQEKRNLSRGFPYKNNHEMDACAAAHYAFMHITPILKTVEEILEGNKEHEAALLREALLHPDAHLRQLLDTLTHPEQPRVIDEPRKPQEVHHRVLSKAEKDVLWLKQQINRLQHELLKNERALGRARQAKGPEAHQEQLALAERRTQSLQDALLHERSRAEQLRAERQRLITLLERADNFVPVRKLHSLSKSEITRAQRGSLLYVERPNMINIPAVQSIAPRLRCILCEHPPSEKLKKQVDVWLLCRGDLEVIAFERFVLIPKDQLERHLQEQALLSNIITEYKEKRAYSLARM